MTESQYRLSHRLTFWLTYFPADKISWEGEFTRRSDLWAGFRASWGSLFPMDSRTASRRAQLDRWVNWKWNLVLYLLTSTLRSIVKSNWDLTLGYTLRVEMWMSYSRSQLSSETLGCNFLAVASLISVKFSHPWIRETLLCDGKTLCTFTSSYSLSFGIFS